MGKKALLDHLIDWSLGIVGTGILFGGSILVAEALTPIVTPLLDPYFMGPKPSIVYYSNGQPALTKTFDTNEELQAYIDTSQAHKTQSRLLGDSSYNDSTSVCDSVSN